MKSKEIIIIIINKKQMKHIILNNTNDSLLKSRIFEFKPNSDILEPIDEVSLLKFRSDVFDWNRFDALFELFSHVFHSVHCCHRCHYLNETNFFFEHFNSTLIFDFHLRLHRSARDELQIKNLATLVR